MGLEVRYATGGLFSPEKENPTKKKEVTIAI